MAGRVGGVVGLLAGAMLLLAVSSAEASLSTDPAAAPQPQSASVTATASATPMPTVGATPLPTATGTPMPSPTSSAAPSPTSAGVLAAPALDATGLLGKPHGTFTPTPSPTLTPASSPTPTVLPPTATPSPTPTAPAATATATRTPTMAPTPTPVPPSGNTDISPDRSATAGPGTAVSYQHTVTHLGKSFDYENITAVSSRGWQVDLLDSDGRPLTDHNNDGIPDTGRLDPGGSTTIVVRVTVPADVAPGVQDVTTVTAVSGRDPSKPGNRDSVTDTTTVGGSLKLTLSTGSVDFGSVAPTGEVDPGVSGVTSTVDDQGAYYVKAGALRASITAGGPWRGSWQAAENVGSSSTLRIDRGVLEWRLSGSDQWTPFSGSPRVWPFANPAAAGADYSFDFRLRVLWTDDPGTFDAPITVSVSQ